MVPPSGQRQRSLADVRTVVEGRVHQAGLDRRHVQVVHRLRSDAVQMGRLGVEPLGRWELRRVCFDLLRFTLRSGASPEDP